MIESSAQADSGLKAMIGIGTASIMLSVGLLPNYIPKIPATDKMYLYEYTWENPCTYLLKNESMPQVLSLFDTDSLVEIPIVKTIEVSYNQPVRLKFKCVEDEKGFIS